ncbi:MAG: hypothetical protein C4547_01225 [Phycisphaerales bacterium]|nr:MAG: hypothetical protein C4547_01225 [Phycisphaerales bacterium]
MPTHPRLERTIDWMLSRWVYVLTGVYLAFVLQAALVPLDFDLGGENFRPFVTGGGPFHWPDTVANIFLYVPLGVLLQWSWHRRLHVALPGAVAAVATAAALSTVVEWVQVYSSTRVSSLVDVAANVTGATLGAFVSLVGHWTSPRFQAYLLEESCARPRETALRAYCFLLLVFALAPFSIMLDPPRLAQAWREASFVPFETSAAHERLAWEAAARGDRVTCAHQRQLKMQGWLKWSLELTSFALLAWLLHAVLVCDYGFRRGGASALCWWIGLGLAGLLSLAQWPVRLRGLDVTDILMRATGLGVGLVTRWGFVERRQLGSLSPGASGALARRWLQRACLASAAFIVVGGLIPFELDRGDDLLRRALASPLFLPGVAYFTARFDVAMADLMLKGGGYVVFSVLFIAARPSLAGDPLERRMRCAVAVCLGISVSIEVAQIRLIGRMPCLTDPLIALVAAAGGAALHQAIWRFVARVHTMRAAALAQMDGTAPADDPAVVHEPRRPTWTLTDALVAGLIDEVPDAPREIAVRHGQSSRP